MRAFSKKVPKTEKVEQILLEKYNQYYRLAYSYVHNEADAADIVQTGAYKAILNSDSLRNIEYAETWIYRIMLNEIFRNVSNQKNVSLEALEIEHGKEDQYENFDLVKSIDSLQEKDKAVIQLRFYEELKLEEIAEILDENVNTIKSRLYRSIKKLRLELTDL